MQEQDFDEIETFFDVVFGAHEGVIALGTITGNKPDNPRAIDNSFFWNWPEDRDKVISFVRRHTREDVYVSPMLYSDRQRKPEYCQTTPVIWCDADAAQPDMFELVPTISIETSPARWHCYWVMDEPESPTWSAKMAKLVAYRHRDEGAGYEGWQLSKYLRVPGCSNTKPTLAEPFKVRLTASGQVYSTEQMSEAFGDPNHQRVIAGPVEKELPEAANLPDREAILAKLPSDNNIARMLYEVPARTSWNEVLWALECRLFRLGLAAEEVFVLVSGCACDKYTRDGRPIHDLWVEVLKAEVSAPNFDENKTPGLITNENADIYSPPPTDRPGFLTDEELVIMQDYPTIIDDYVSWGRTRTEADPRYHEMAGMILLSTILSDFGHAVPRFGNMKLNMWVMLLGVTTRTYKTTARKLMLEILGPLDEPTEGYEYKMGSDATPEGLIVELSQYPNRSKLFFRDEVSGMFQEMRGGKGYMSGLGETMTELFDGHVHGRLRATGANKKTPEVDTAFNMYLMGVPGKVAEILNPDDFATGFLARFLYVIGEPGPRTKESMYLAQQPEEHTRTEDPQAKALRAQLSQIRYFWQQRCGQPGHTVPIRVDPEAWERYNIFIEDLTVLAGASDNAEVLEPSSDRMNKHVLKLACLLAMADKNEVVQMHHMVRAIWYAEGWYQGMVQVSQLIQTSEWSGKVDKLIKYVGSLEQVKYEMAYRKFRDLKPKEFQELVASAVEAGMLRHRQDESKVSWLSL